MKKLIQKILRNFGYKLVNYESLTYNKRFLEIYERFKQVTDDLEQNSIEGVYVECGFGFGRSFTVLGHFAHRYAFIAAMFGLNPKDPILTNIQKITDTGRGEELRGFKSHRSDKVIT
jgi:hypothetical protein